MSNQGVTRFILIDISGSMGNKLPGST